MVKNEVITADNGSFFSKEDCIAISNNLMAHADTEHGGFGKAPKFPQTFSIN